ncbi:MAG: hypothetical protein GX780_05425 [Campylobacteraceae bacterium]|nr:hypothetical protein [Campylobacteraceae bacterium]
MTKSIILLITWFILIFTSYKFVLYNVKRIEKAEKKEHTKELEKIST